MPKKVTLKKRTPKILIKNKDAIDKSRMTDLSMKLFTTFILIIFIYGIIMYLKNLEKCECIANKREDIKTLLYIEYILITISIINFITGIFIMMNPKQIGGSKYLYFMIAMLILFVFIYGLLIYNAYKIFNGVNEQCECSMGSLRYLLYIQILLAIYKIITIIRSIGFLMIFL